MKKRRSILALLLVFLLTATQGAFASGTASSNLYAIGDSIEDLPIPTTDGQITSLSELLTTHKAVLLNFWFVGCTWCNMEFPDFESIQAQYGDDLAIVALSPCDTLESIADFQQENAQHFYMGTVDMSLAMAKFIPDNTFPTTLLIDRNGVFCYQQIGAFDSDETIKRLILPYLASDYTEPVLINEIPPAQPNDAMPSAQALAETLGDANGQIVYSASDLTNAWPWLIGFDGNRTCAYSSNKGYNNTTACLRATLNVSEGDALVFDYKTSSADCSDYLRVYVNGIRVKMFSGIRDWETYAYRFPTSGEMTVEFRYVKDAMNESGDDTASVSNIRLLTGEDALNAINANIQYPATLLGKGCRLTPLGQDIREIQIAFSEPVAHYNDYPTAFYISPAESVQFLLTIGSAYDPDGSSINYPQNEESLSLSRLPTDDTGFLVVMPMANDFDNSWNVGFVEAVPLVGADDPVEPGDTYHVFVFSSEQSATEYCQNTLPGLIGGIQATWSYRVVEESNAPSSTAPPETAENVETNYTLKFIDQNGEPVQGVIANICDENSCSPMVSDAQGTVAFTRAGRVYDLHILKAPKGYLFDTSQAFKTDAAGGEMTFTLQKQ